MRFTLHHHFLRCLFCREQDINMHRIYGRWVLSRVSSLLVFWEDFGELSPVSPPCNHLHFCRSRKRLLAVRCLACLCAKSYKGVINLDLSASVRGSEYVCRLVWDVVLFCLSVCVFVQVCVNAVIPMFHTFASLSGQSVSPLSASNFQKTLFQQLSPMLDYWSCRLHWGSMTL